MAAGGGLGRLGPGGGGALPGGRALPGARTLGPWQIVLLLLALLVGGIGGYIGFTNFWESSHAPPTFGTPFRVATTTIRNTVSATGTVTATEQTNLVFQASGQITQIFVKAGDSVKAGQPIAALDSRAATIARDQARSALNSAQAKLDALLAPPTPDVVAAAEQSVASAQTGVASAQQSVASAQAGVTTAQATLTNSEDQLAALLNGATPTQIEQAQASVDAADRSLQIAQYNYDQLVNHSNLASRPEVTNLATAKQNYQTALANYLSKLTPPLSTTVAQAETNLTLAENALQAAQLRNLQVQADPTAAVSDKVAAQDAVQSAQAAVAQAQTNIQTLQQGTDQVDIAAAQAQLNGARTQLESATTTYDNLLSLSTLNSQPEYSAFQTAASNYETAQANLDNVMAPPQQTTVSSDQAAINAAQAGIPSAQASLNAAQAGVPSSQAALNAARAKLTQTLAPPLPTDVTQAQEAVHSAQLALQNAQLTLDNDTLVAPFDGVIISVPVDIGQQVSSATTITTLTNPSALEVDANVDETSVTQLKVGQQATVTLDALPGKTFNAVVEAVTPSGTTQQGVVVFPIVLRIDTNNQTVPAGASANITITTSVTPNVLAVPARYVHVQNGRQVVDTIQNGKRVSVPVTTGVTNGQLTQITSGLQQGETAIPPAQNRQTATFGAGGFGGGGAGGPPPGGP
jgi:HlyD family secretion protein